MSSKLLIALSLLAATAQSADSASTTTVSLFMPESDPQSLVASVVGADSSATTYVITCPSGTPSDECGYNPAQTVTQGPSIAAGVIEAYGATGSWSCALSGPATSATEASCVVAASVGSMDLSSYASQFSISTEDPSDSSALSSALSEVAGSTTRDTTILSADDITYSPVVVTAGVEKLAGNASSTASASSSASASGSANGSGSASAASKASATGASSTASGSTGSAAPAATGAAGSNKQFGMAAAGVAGVALVAFAL